MIEIHLTELPVFPCVEITGDGTVRVVMNQTDSLATVLESCKEDLAVALCHQFFALWADPDFPRIFTVDGPNVTIRPDLGKLRSAHPQSETD